MDSPIGIFDSGVGGTSIWKEITKLLPIERTIYLADSRHAPYGEKRKEKILERCINNVELLLEKDCKLIVVACNTATTNAIDYLREHYSVPFIGIEPAIKPAALQTKTKKVGVLATKGTLASDLFNSTAKLHASGIEVFEREGRGLVELIEAGKTASEETEQLLKGYLHPMVQENVDCMVLGCTHYPYLIPVLEKLLPPHVKIIDSGEAVARQTKNVLEKKELLNSALSRNPQYVFYTNKDLTVLNTFVNRKETKISFLDF
ncbi:glutamate racemase [Allomuricauda sp. SCSIO 65647]|uniref:glutamate racemase n=1 Tax=Allomuricauda sp. SCSIO 65647 TaxID=2908843 RepID=UPI001F46E88C|nr:glutamate racemase [Muricauda sp. SCSIO 65647]UJH68290.1 glutamate racemase [Muricauda sp. SCSIO 65647]